MSKPGTKTWLLFCLTLVAGFFVAGCGGGGGQSEDQSQGGGGSKEQADQGQEKKAPESKIALGRVVSANPEAKRIYLRPSNEEQGKKPIPFKLTPKATITLDGEEVELDAVEKGQQAQIEYVVRKDLNRARGVDLFNAGGGGETTGENTG